MCSMMCCGCIEPKDRCCAVVMMLCLPFFSVPVWFCYKKCCYTPGTPLIPSNNANLYQISNFNNADPLQYPNQNPNMNQNMNKNMDPNINVKISLNQNPGLQNNLPPNQNLNAGLNYNQVPNAYTNQTDRESMGYPSNNNFNNNNNNNRVLQRNDFIPNSNQNVLIQRLINGN